MATKRIVDSNGYTRIKDNPISKVGVFDYLGSSLGPEFRPDEIYKVYRPESSLNNQETIDSFKCVPWIDDHEMLGEGFTDPERKGIHGVTGDDAYFEYPYLKVNLNIFSEHLDDIIDNGKKELSPGYRCKYRKESGTFEGEEYQVVQYGMLGNHLATVEEGRTGPDVSVMDHKMTFTFDSKDLVMPKEENKDFALDEGMKGQMMDAMSNFMKDEMPGMMKDMMSGMMKDMMHSSGEDEEESEAEDKDESEDKDACDKDKDEKGEGMDSAVMSKAITDAVSKAVAPLQTEINSLKTSAMDSKAVITEMNKRDALVAKVSPFIGAFDHSDKTLAEVEKYSCEKLGLDATEGMEGSILTGFLHNRKPAQSFTPITGMDSADGSNPVTDFLNGGDK